MKLTWTEGKDGVLEARIGGEKCWVYPASGEHCAIVVVPTNNADTGWHYRHLPTTDDPSRSRNSGQTLPTRWGNE